MMLSGRAPGAPPAAPDGVADGRGRARGGRPESRPGTGRTGPRGRFLNRPVGRRRRPSGRRAGRGPGWRACPAGPALDSRRIVGRSMGSRIDRRPVVDVSAMAVAARGWPQVCNLPGWLPRTSNCSPPFVAVEIRTAIGAEAEHGNSLDRAIRHPASTRDRAHTGPPSSPQCALHDPCKGALWEPRDSPCRDPSRTP